MAGLLAAVAVLGSLAAVVLGFVGLAAWMRRRGLGGGVMGPIDEIYHPAGVRFRREAQVQEQRLAPRPSPDDRWTTRGRDEPDPSR